MKGIFERLWLGGFALDEVTKRVLHLLLVHSRLAWILCDITYFSRCSRTVQRLVRKMKMRKVVVNAVSQKLKDWQMSLYEKGVIVYFKTRPLKRGALVF